jgi:glucokinase
MTAPVLLADIGGTNARFALADLGGDAATGDGAATVLREGSVREFAVAQFPSLPETARHYLGEVGARPEFAVMAVAGRVDGDEARITNHPWVISGQRTRLALGLADLRLVNDFAAQAMAISLLRADDVVPIGGVGWHDTDPAGDRTYAVIGPGTGLGVGGLLRRDGRWYPLQTEGGHVSFAPGTPEEIAILQTLSGEFGRVSAERIVSGMGLVNLYRALSLIAGEDPGPLTAPDVTARAAAGDPRCARAIDVFCAVFGACAGDLVLTLGAWDGVFLAGGLVPRLLRELQHSGFRQRFEHKGRFSPTMARIPTLAVLHPQPGLLGAAATARQWLGAP